jgi:hypothetical protein
VSYGIALIKNPQATPIPIDAAPKKMSSFNLNRVVDSHPNCQIFLDRLA